MDDQHLPVEERLAQAREEAEEAGDTILEIELEYEDIEAEIRDQRQQQEELLRRRAEVVAQRRRALDTIAEIEALTANQLELPGVPESPG